MAIGQYKGIDITPGDDANIQAQLKAIDNPTPVAPTTPKVTADTPLSTPQSYLSTYDTGESYKSPQDLRNQQDLSKGEVSRLRKGVMSQYQGEIDAAKSAYARLLAEQQQLGVGRLGETTAIQARRGLQGSSFGTGMTEGVRKTNLNAEGTVLEGQASAIAGIMSRANKAAQDEIDYQRAAKKGGLKEYQDAKSKQGERKQVIVKDVAKNLLLGNVTYDMLPDSDKAALKGMGISQQDIINSYLEQKTAQDKEKAKEDAQMVKDRSFALGEGQDYYQYNPTTGKQELIASKAKTYAPESSNSYYGGYDEDQNKKISSIDSAISKNGTYVKTSNMRGYADSVLASLSQGTGTGDLAAINQFQKVIDEGAVTRDQDVKLIQDSQSLSNKLQTYAKKLAKGEQLSPELRSQMKTTVESIYGKQIEALAKDPFINAKKSELNRYNIDPNDTIIGELGAYTQDEQQPQNTIEVGPDGQEYEFVD